MPQLELIFESGDESLSVRSFRVEEGLNDLFTVAITARSVDPDLDLASFVGQRAAFLLAGGVERERRWTGICSRMEQVRVEPKGLSTYDLTIVPRLWFLTQRRNHRLFQHQSIPDILDKLLAEWGIEPAWQIDRGSYPSLELRIQYGESDYAFLSRLVEEAGITFSFAPEPGKGSRLVFADRPQGADPRPSLLPFVDAPEASQAGRLEYLTAVRVSDQVRPGKLVVRDFDFRRPAHRLVGDASAGAGGLDAMLEQYHYLPGAALAETGEAGNTPVGDDKGVGRHADATGQGLAQRSLQSHRALKRAVHYQTNAFDLAPGVVFGVDRHPRSDLAADKLLLVVHARLEGTVGEEWTMSGKALFTDQPHYPAQVTPKPRIHGVQSAVVVGPDGQEIHTDEYGRVRVQFHWDREGEFNEESFVWIRVSQGWAGGGYGMLSLPRVGHEVLVQFMDGDPDSPLVVGRAFNASTTVPYALPDHKTVSTWRSASSPGADGFNEIKMEDKKGQELLYMQAEKDHARLVKNDEVSLIGNDRTKMVEHDEMSSIKNDRVKVVQHDERVSVQNDRTGLVGNDEHLAVGRDRVAQIKKNETLAVGENHAIQVGKSASLSVGEDRAAHVGKSDQTSVGESQSVTVGQSRSATIGINDNTLVGSQYSVTIANGLGGKVSGILGKLLDGSVLGSLGSIASPLVAGPMQKVMSLLGKGPFGDTPLPMFIQGPMATLEAVLPGKLKQVASMMSGPLSSVFGAGEQPTSFVMVDKKITLTTGDATIQLEGGKITLSAKEGIFLDAGQVIDLTAGMMLQAQANALVKIQAGPTPVPSPKGGPATKFAPAVGDLLLVGMKQVEVGAKELMVLGSQKEMVLVAKETISVAGDKGITVVSASGNTIVKGKMVQLNPPSAKSKSAGSDEATDESNEIHGEKGGDTVFGSSGRDDIADASGQDRLLSDTERGNLGSAIESTNLHGPADGKVSASDLQAALHKVVENVVSGQEPSRDLPPVGAPKGPDDELKGSTRTVQTDLANSMESVKTVGEAQSEVTKYFEFLKGEGGKQGSALPKDPVLIASASKDLTGLLADEKPSSTGKSLEDGFELAGNPKSDWEKLQDQFSNAQDRLAIWWATLSGQAGSTMGTFAEFANGLMTTGTPSYALTLNIMRQTGAITESDYQQLNNPSYAQAGGSIAGGIFALLGPGKLTGAGKVVVGSTVRVTGNLVKVQGKLVPVVMQRVTTNLAGGSQIVVRIPGMRDIVMSQAQAYTFAAGFMTVAGTGAAVLPAPAPKK
jgi:type VI secretion system secreted protein VgrG